jgi:hypothetical protein
MIVFAGITLFCRMELKHTGIAAASFTTIRFISGTATLPVINADILQQ